MAAFTPGMAAHDAPQGQTPAFENAVLLNRLVRIGRARGKIAATGREIRAKQVLIEPDQGNDYLAHRAIFFQCLDKARLRTVLQSCSRFFCAITTISRPLKSTCLRRKLSRIRRFTRFLVTAKCMCFFAMARPKRAKGNWFCLARTMNCPSIERRGCLNTRLNSSGFLSLLAGDKPCCKDVTILGRQSLAPLGPACLDNRATGLGLHPQAEAVAALAFKSAWLVCALHYSSLSVANF